MQKDDIKVTWYGTASVQITDGKTTFIADPFIPMQGSRIKLPEGAYSDCRTILITHGHYDHTGSIPKLINDRTRIYCSDTPMKKLCSLGINPGIIVPVRNGCSFDEGDFHITVFKGKHIRFGAGLVLRTVFSKKMLHYGTESVRRILTFSHFHENNETLCYLAQINKKRIFIMGSMALDDHTEYPEGVDLLLLPYQGTTKLLESALEICRRIRPCAVLLTHCDDTFPPMSSDIDTTEFEEYMKGKATVYRIKQGSSIVI